MRGRIVLTPDLILREVAQGRQAYIVLPWLKNQKSWMFVQLLRSINGFRKASFPQFQVGLLHGRMTSADKDEAISRP